MIIRFSMKDCKLVATLIAIDCKLMKEYSSPLVNAILYRSLIDSFMYLIAKWYDIMFVVSLVSQFMLFSHESYWKMAKIILHYVDGAKNHDLWYKVIELEYLIAYIDAN